MPEEPKKIHSKKVFRTSVELEILYIQKLVEFPEELWVGLHSSSDPSTESVIKVFKRGFCRIPFPWRKEVVWLFKTPETLELFMQTYCPSKHSFLGN